MGEELPVAVLVSGEGTTLDALAELVRTHRLPVEIALVVADRPRAPAIEKARRRHLPVLVLPSKGVEREAWAGNLTVELEARGVRLVVLAGFLSILPPSWVEHWKGRAINIHPSLLPKYGGPGMYGPHVHEAVIRSGDPETGATVHLLTNDLDAGPTIVQERVPVRPGETPDSLRERLHPVEVRLLADVIRRFAEGRLPLPYPGPGVDAERGGH